MVKIQYQKDSGKVILPETEFNYIINGYDSKDFEFEEVEFMTIEEEETYDEAIKEYEDGDTISYEELINFRGDIYK